MILFASTPEEQHAAALITKRENSYVREVARTAAPWVLMITLGVLVTLLVRK